MIEIVTAYRLDHRVECYGYRIEEHPNRGAKCKNWSKMDPSRALDAGAEKGEVIELEDGRTVNGADYLEPVAGKVVAMFGDTINQMRCYWQKCRCDGA